MTSDSSISEWRVTKRENRANAEYHCLMLFEEREREPAFESDVPYH